MILRSLLIFIILIIHAPLHAGVSASLDRSRTFLDDPVQMTIISDQEQAEQKLDTRALEQDFTIAGRSSSTQISMRNGKVKNESRIILSLLPKREGTLQIPPLAVGNEHTPPLQLEVEPTPDSVPAQQGDGHPGVLIEAEWEDTTLAYVQGQITLIIRIYHQGNLLDAALDEPRPEKALMLRLGDDLQGVRSRDGQQYQTIERRYALFPQESGVLEVPPMALQVRIADTEPAQAGRFGFTPFNRGKQLTLRSRPLTLEIRPPVPGYSGTVWLPARKVELERTGIPQQSIQLGDAINLGITLSALGLTGQQLPQVELKDPEAHFKVYPDQPQFENRAEGTRVKGAREQTLVLIPTKSGTLQLPMVEVTWWDLENNREQTTQLPPVSVEVIAAQTADGLPGAEHRNAMMQGAAEGTISNSSSTGQDSANGVDPLWKWLSLISLTAWAVTLVAVVLLFRTRRREGLTPAAGVETVSLHQARRQIESAARSGQAEDTLRALREYAITRWPDNPPTTPETWAERLQNQEVEQILEELNASLYRHASSMDWTGQRLIEQLMPLLKSDKGKRAPASRSALPELYP